MKPYLGEYRHTVDAAGRLNVPAKFRETLEQESSPDLVMIKGLEGCIYLLPLSTWAKYRAAMDRDEFVTDRRARWFLHDLLEDGGVEQPDSQGRIQLTKGLRKFSGITDTAVVYGKNDLIQVWAPKTFDAYVKAGKQFGGSLEEGAALFLRRSGSSDPGRGAPEGNERG